MWGMTKQNQVALIHSSSLSDNALFIPSDHSILHKSPLLQAKNDLVLFQYALFIMTCCCFRNNRQRGSDDIEILNKYFIETIAYLEVSALFQLSGHWPYL